MQKINSVTWHKVNLQNNRIAVKVAIINIWLITGISFTFAAAMIERRERIRSLLHFPYRPEGLKKKGYEF